jgi:dTDP-4-dehydrorhamnose reductase
MSDNHKGRLLITGASGLLGSKLQKIAEGKFNLILLHNTRPLSPNSLELDITNQKEVTKLFNDLKPEIVIHTASETNVDKCELQKEHAWKTNVEGTCNIARACKEIDAKLAYISTDYVFDGEKGNYKEEDKPNPISYYGITKLEGENQVIQNCNDHVILRTSVIYGWHQWKQNFATWVINQLRQNKEITVVDDHYNTPTLADNLAEMTIEALQSDLHGLYHASGIEKISRYDFAIQIAGTFRLNPNLVKPIKMSQLTAWVAKRPRNSSLNMDKIQKHLKTKPLNITDGLNKMKQKEKET